MKTNLLALDIETGGLDAQKNSILSLGAVDIDTGEEFYIECRNQIGRTLDEFALKVNGFTEEQANDPNKVLPHYAYEMLVNWVEEKGLGKLLVGENLPSFDVQFLKDAQKNSAKAWIFGHRYLDLGSVAYLKFKKRIKMDEISVALGLGVESQPHNALTGARLTRDIIVKLINE